MGILVGFAPWIVYWVLVGNVPFAAAALVALAVAAGSLVIGRINRSSLQTLEFGAVATFLVLLVLTFTLSRSVLESWLPALSAAAALLVVLAGVLLGKPFAREVAAAELPADVAKSDPFGRVTTTVTWVWAGAFAGMTVSSLIPPLVRHDASLLDTRTPVSYLCYWVIPLILVAAAVLATRLLTERLIAEATSPHTVRRTTFVAFKELEIDQLYYLAREKADREAGAGMEAYDVKIGSQGVPLTGDESRESWPATYKARPARH